MNFSLIPLVTGSGERYTLSQLVQKDKLNLLLFYNHDCLGCTGRALPLAYKLQQTYPKIQLIVIHSTFGNRSYTSNTLESIFTSGKSPFPIYMEAGHELFDYLGCEGTPHWLFMDDTLHITHSIFGSQEGAQMKLNYAIQEWIEKS